MEQFNPKRQKSEQSHNKGTQKRPNNAPTKSLKNAGKVIFKKVKNPQKKFQQAIPQWSPILQSRVDSKLFIVQSGQSHKIYKVAKNRVEFVSSHMVDFPVYGTYKTSQRSEDRIREFFWKKRMKKISKNLEFFEREGIDWETSSWLVFEYSYGVDQPEIIRPRFLGELEHKREDIKRYEVPTKCGEYRSLFNTNLCLLEDDIAVEDPSNRGTYKIENVHYLVRFGKKFTNSAQKVFKFNLDYQRLETSKKMVQKQKKKLRPIFINEYELNKKETLFSFRSGKRHLQHGLTSFVRIEGEMLSVGLFHLRTRKVVSKRFVAIYELFVGLDFAEVAELQRCSILDVAYSSQVDTLAFNVRLDLLYSSLEQADSLRVEGATKRSAGRRKPQSRYFFHYHRRYGSIREYKRVCFQISNLFGKEERRVEVRGSCLLQKGPKSLFFIEPDDSEFRMDVVTKGPGYSLVDSSSLTKRTNNLLRARRARKKSDRDQKEEKQILTKNLLFPLESQLKKLGITSHDIRSAFSLEDSQLLIVCSRKILLFDIKSKTFLSACHYCDNVPNDLFRTLIDNDVMLTIQNKKFMEVLKIVNEDDDTHQFRFEFIGVLDSEAFRDVYSIINLLFFKRVGEHQFEFKAKINWKESRESDLLCLAILSVRFEIRETKIRHKDSYELRLISRRIDSRIEGFERIKGSYAKGGQVNHILRPPNFNHVKRLAVQITESQGGGDVAMYTVDYPPPNLTAGYNERIEKAYIKDNFAYLYLKNVKKEIRVIDYQVEDDRLTDPSFVKSLTLHLSAEVFFDKQTEEFRIFCFNQKGLDSSLLRLTILDEQLDEVLSVIIDGILKVQNLNIVNSNYLHIVGPKTELEELEDQADTSEPVEEVKVSLMVNLAEMTFKELVSEDDKAFCSVNYGPFCNRLLAFRRDCRAMWEASSNGVFASENLL